MRGGLRPRSSAGRGTHQAGMRKGEGEKGGRGSRRVGITGDRTGSAGASPLPSRLECDCYPLPLVFIMGRIGERRGGKHMATDLEPRTSATRYDAFVGKQVGDVQARIRRLDVARSF